MKFHLLLGMSALVLAAPSVLAQYKLYRPVGALTVTSTSNACVTPWGATLQQGQSVDAYLTATGTAQQPCSKQVRTCMAGTLTGTYTFAACTVPVAPAVNYAKLVAGPYVSTDGYSVSAPVANYGRVVASQPITSGKHYVEANLLSYRTEFGLTTQSTNDLTKTSAWYPLESKPDAVALYHTSVYSYRLAYIHSSAGTPILNTPSVPTSDTGIVGMGIDADNNTVTWYNAAGAIATVSVRMAKPWYVTIGRGNSNPEGALRATLNSGQSAFSYSVPYGYRKGLYP